jgi:hypothetical protein
MRNRLLLTVSIAAICSIGSAYADAAQQSALQPAPDIRGALEVGGSYGTETDGLNSVFWIVNLGAKFTYQIDESWASQLDLFVNESPESKASWFGEYGEASGLHTYGGAVHVNDSVGDFKFGPFLMMEGTTVGDSYYSYVGTGTNLYLAFGGEARWQATPDLDFSAQVGGLFHLAAPAGAPICYALCDAVFVGGDATWFYDDNTAVNAHFAYLGGHGGEYWAGPDRAQTGWQWGVQVEHQFNDSPFAAYVAYDGDSWAWDGYYQHDHVISIGLKFYFNGDTIRQHHETGGFRTPHFERMINQSLSTNDMGLDF